MGDTGSLALGGVLAGLAVCTKTQLLLVILGGLFVIITLSVIIQVGSYKMTGRRVFKMAPLQHHFELLGWAETTIVVRFWLIAGVVHRARPRHLLRRLAAGVAGCAPGEGRAGQPDGCAGRIAGRGAAAAAPGPAGRRLRRAAGARQRARHFRPAGRPAARGPWRAGHGRRRPRRRRQPPGRRRAGRASASPSSWTRPRSFPPGPISWSPRPGGGRARRCSPTRRPPASR